MSDTKHVRVRKQVVDEITCDIASRFRCFGRGSTPVITGNPISIALKDEPAQFAAGVDVASVVEQVIVKYRKLNSET